MLPPRHFGVPIQSLPIPAPRLPSRSPRLQTSFSTIQSGRLQPGGTDSRLAGDPITANVPVSAVWHLLLDGSLALQ